MFWALPFIRTTILVFTVITVWPFCLLLLLLLLLLLQCAAKLLLSAAAALAAQLPRAAPSCSTEATAATAAADPGQDNSL